MARIAGVDLPREKRVEIALTYIFGIGRPTSSRILGETGVSPDTRVRDLSDAEVARLRDAGANFRNDIVEGPGGKQILLQDPSGNVVELFQPAAR